MTDPAAFPISIALHIGAHKTATTHLQRSLQAARPALAKHGVRFMGPADLRPPAPSLRAMFGAGAIGSDETTPETYLAQMVGDGHRLVLSEENLIGTLHNGKGRVVTPLYPDTADEVEAVVAGLSPHPVDIFLAIRHPARFLTSAYCQSLMADTVITPEVFRKKNPLDGVDWAHLVTRLRSVRGIGRIIVWQHEEYARLFAKVTAHLVGAAAHVKPLPGRVHQGLSAAAVADVLVAYAAGKRGKLARAARRIAPISDAHPAFDAFSPIERARANARYAVQVSAIEMMPGVTLLRPPLGTAAKKA